MTVYLLLNNRRTSIYVIYNTLDNVYINTFGSLFNMIFHERNFISNKTLFSITKKHSKFCYGFNLFFTANMLNNNISIDFPGTVSIKISR